MIPSVQALPLVAGICVGIVGGQAMLRWVFPPVATMAESRSGVAPAKSGPHVVAASVAEQASEPRAIASTAPTSPGEWLSLVEPLDPEGTETRLQAALAGLDADSLATLWEELSDVLIAEEGGMFLACAFAERAADLDLKRFMDVAMDRSDAMRHTLWGAFRNRLLSRWAATDMDAAAAVLEHAPSDREREAHWAALASARTGRSFDAAWQGMRDVFERHGTPAEQARGFEKTLGVGALRALAQVYPREMRQWLQDQRDRFGGPQAALDDQFWWRLVASAISSRHEPGSEHEPEPVPSVEPPEREPALEPHNMKHWADRDPQSAAQWVQAQAAGEVDKEDVLLVVRALANVDPGGLPRLLQSLDAATRAEAVMRAAPQLGRHDPAAAGAAVLALPDEKARESALAAITEAVAVRGASGGLAWVQGLPVELQPAAAGGLVNTLTVYDPSLAAETAAAWVEEGHSLPELPVVTLAKEWATGAPADAAVWAAALPTGPVQEFAARAVAVTWAAHDVEAARDWIESWPESRVKYECEKLVPAP